MERDTARLRHEASDGIGADSAENHFGGQNSPGENHLDVRERFHRVVLECTFLASLPVRPRMCKEDGSRDVAR